MKYISNLLPGFIETHNYIAVWFLMWVETFFPVFPSEVIIPLGVQAVNHGAMNAYGLAIASICGSMTGALMWYSLTRWLGFERFAAFLTRYGRWTTLNPKDVTRLQNWFTRYGYAMVLVGRVVPLLRSAVSIPAGLTRMPFIPFFILTLIGTSIWSCSLTYASWLFRAQIEAFHHLIGPVVTLIVIALIILWFYRVFTHKAHGHSEA